MNYYIQGDAAKAQQIKAAFEAKAIYNGSNLNFTKEDRLFYSCDGKVYYCSNSGGLAHIIKTHHDYQELELPLKPKFKAEDRIVNKSDKSTIYRIIALHEERREYIVDIEHKDYHESCPWIAYEDQDDYELAPKKHYAIANFRPFDKVLGRDYDEGVWICDLYSYYYKGDNKMGVDNAFVCVGDSHLQCIPYEGNEHLLGTTDMCDECYINW